MDSLGAFLQVLLVEDDAMLGDALRSSMVGAGLRVDWVRDVPAARLALVEHGYGAVLLDLGLPGGSGLAVLKHLRARYDATPVLIITARDRLSERVQGLDAGADDYIVKPYDVDELLARMRALIRRSAGRAEPVFEHDGITIDPQSHAATVDGTPVPLTAREWAVLEPLIARPGMIFSRAQLEEKLYSWKDSVSSNAVEVYIHGLRKKLGQNLIQNVRGVGYVIPKT